MTTFDRDPADAGRRTADSSAPRQRRLHRSLAALLVVAALAMIAQGWSGVRQWQTEREQAAKRAEAIAGQRAVTFRTLALAERLAGALIPFRADLADRLVVSSYVLAERTRIIVAGGAEVDITGTSTGRILAPAPAVVGAWMARPGGALELRAEVGRLVTEITGNSTTIDPDAPRLARLRTVADQLVVEWTAAVVLENEVALADRGHVVGVAWIVGGVIAIVGVAVAAATGSRRRSSIDKARAAQSAAATRRLGAILDQSHDTVVIMSAAREHLFVSNGITRLLGTQPEESLGRLRPSPMRPDEIDGLRTWFDDLFASPGASRVTEFHARHVDGRWIPIEMRATNLVDDPSIGGALITLRDQSAQRAAEARVLASEQRHRSLIEASPDAVVVIEDLVIVSANRAAAELRGVDDPAELIGRPMTEMVVADDASVVLDAAIRFAAGDPFVEPVRMRVAHTSGDVRLTEARPVEVAGTSRTTTAMVVIHDVTARESLLRDLALSERRGRFLAENSEVVLLQLDADRRVRFATSACESLLDLTPDEIEGVELTSFVEPTFHHLVDQAFARATDLGTREVVEVLVRRATPGIVTWVEASVRSVVDDDGALGFHASIADVSERRAALEALATSERRNRVLVSNAPIGIFEDDATGQRRYVNGAYLEILGAPEESSVLGLGWMDFAHPDDLPAIRERVERASTTTEVIRLERRIVRPSGEERAVDIAIVPLTDDGVVTGYLGTVVDVTESRRLQTELAARERRFRRLADGASDVVYRLSLDGDLEFEYVSPSITTVTGRTPDEVLADTYGALMTILHEEDLPRLAAALKRTDHLGTTERLELRWVDTDGTIRWADHSFTIERDPNGNALTVDGIARDISDLKRAEEELRNLAHVDALTGLPNRRSVLGTLARRAEAGTPVAVMFLDLDGFKAVNDTLGHEAGDELLIQVATRIESVTRQDDVVGRLGGDEFVVVCDPGAARPLAQRVLAAISEPYLLAAGPADISASIGVAIALDDEPASDTLRRADEAMYDAKHAGKAQIRVTTDA